jgi:hypothetical protein
VSYLIAAYAVTAGSLLVYAISMLRERGRLVSGTKNTPENSRMK